MVEQSKNTIESVTGSLEELAKASLPTLSWNRSDAEKKLHKAAKAKLMTGKEICLSKEPDNPIVRRMADKYAY